MNSDIIKQAGALAEAFRNSAEYRAYVTAREKTRLEPDLARKIADYKAARYDFRLRALSGETPPADRERVLSGLYADLTLNETARRFLSSEDAVFSLVVEVNDILEEAYEDIETDI